MKTRHITLLLTLLFSVSAVYSQQVGGYKPAPVNHHEYRVLHLKTNELPNQYDSRGYGYITESRNQQIGGTCWAFATCDAVEALYNKLGYDEGYLSPQLISNCHYGFLWEKTLGGNFDMSISILANMKSLAYENSFPYDAYDTECKPFTANDFPAYTLGAYILPEGDMTAIKECIYEYGAVGASMFYDNAYYDSKTNTYKYTGDEFTNHAISLIGWDDEKEAFIAKFNWGTTKFDKGVMYISYADTKITSECYAFTDRTEKAQVQNVYYYDKSGYTGYYPGKGHTISGLSYFTPTKKEILTKVGTYVSKASTEVTFTVMVGADVVLEKTIECPYAGFYSVALDTPVEVEDRFIVAVDYYDEIPLETNINEYNDPEFIPVGNQYIQVDGKEEVAIGTDSKDVKFRNVNLCIKAYTIDHLPTSDTNIQGTETPEIEGVDIYKTDGQFVKTVERIEDFNSKGLFIFVEHYKNTQDVKSHLVNQMF